MAYTHITPGWEIEMSAHYYPDKKADRVAELIQLPREELTTMEEASVAQEKAIFSKFSEIEAEWRKQAAETIAIRKAREYLRALPVEHTSNQWKVNQFGWNVLSNMVYKMSYRVSENKTPDGTLINCTLSWDIHYNTLQHPTPDYTGDGWKIAGQSDKRFATKEELERYLQGRIKAYTQDPEKTSLEAAIDYALDREKTEQTCFETAVNCDRESVYADMMDTKRRWGKEGRKRKGYHIIQSFAPGEVTPDQAHAVGVEFARRLLGDRYEAVVSTHLNKAHLHSHIVFNSVSFVDGAMYRDQLKDYYGGDGVGIRGTSDAICREHGLSIIEPSEPLGGPVSRAEWEAARQGKATVRDLIRQDVDEAIRQAYTYQSFLSQLRRMGYRVKTGPRVKHTAILPPGGKGYIRLDSLKDGYTEADIQARLAAVRSGEAPPDTPPTTFSRLLEPGRRYRVRGGMPRRPRKLTGFQALCFQYLCLLGAYPKRRPGNRAAFSMREELLKLDRYQEQFRYLRKNRIETAAQLSMQYDAIQAEIDALTERRGQLYRQKRRGDGGGEIQTEIEQITTHLRALRRDLKLCARIEGDIPKVRAAVEAQRPDHARRRPYEKTAPRGPDRHSGIDTALSAHRGREH